MGSLLPVALNPPKKRRVEVSISAGWRPYRKSAGKRPASNLPSVHNDWGWRPQPAGRKGVGKEAADALQHGIRLHTRHGDCVERRSNWGSLRGAYIGKRSGHGLVEGEVRDFFWGTLPEFFPGFCPVKVLVFPPGGYFANPPGKVSVGIWSFCYRQQQYGYEQGENVFDKGLDGFFMKALR